MKNINDTFSIWLRRWRGGLMAGLALAVLATGARAQDYTLSVANSSINVNLSSGLSDWVYNGANQLGQQSFYYSLGADEYPISTISSPSSPVFTGSGFGGAILDTNMSVTYANSTLSLTTDYQLGVYGTGASLTTALTIDNLSGTSQTLELYQLSNFTLGGAIGSQVVQFLTTTNPYAVTQTGPGGTVLNGSLSGVALGKSVLVEEMAGTNDFGLGNGNADPPFNDSSLSATGSVDYAYEFTVTLAAGSGVSISELQVVPEPSSLSVISCGLAGLLGVGLLRRRGLALLKK